MPHAVWRSSGRSVRVIRGSVLRLLSGLILVEAPSDTGLGHSPCQIVIVLHQTAIMIWKTSRENNITRDVKLNASLSRGFYYRLYGHWQAGFPHYCRLLPGAPYTPRSQHINLTQGCTYRLGLELPYHMNCTRMI